VRALKAALGGAVLLALMQCSSPPRRDDMVKLDTLAKERTGQAVAWRNTAEVDETIRREVKSTLARSFSIDDAVRISLLNNPDLQARFDRLGAAVADVWQAGLLKNPAFDFSARIPVHGGASKIESGLDLSLTDLFLRSARTRMAEAEALEVQQLAAQAIQDLALETRRAYIELQTNLHKFKIEKLNFETAEQSIVMHRRLHAAGNINDLELSIEEANFSEIRSGLQKAEIEVRLSREQLNRLMGVWGEDINWQIPDAVPALAREENDLANLENAALKNRSDLKAVGQGLEFYRAELDATKSVRWMPGFDAGVDTITEGSDFKIGPKLRFEIPIFDRGDARIEKIANLYRMRLRELENLAINIRADVRVARDKMIAARQQVMFYHRQVLPQRARATQLMQVQYNAMLAGIFHLITARQNELKAEKEYLDFHRNYYVARAELERAAGIRLSPPRSSTTPPRLRGGAGGGDKESK